MPTPLLIETGPSFVGDGPSDFTTQNSDCGPWEFGNSRFFAMQEIDLSSFVASCAFRKTSDGVTFSAPLDFANAPAGDVFTCFKRDSETTISFLVMQAVGFNQFNFVSIGVFDISAGNEKYTANISLTSPPDTAIFPIHLVKLSSGNYGVFYSDVIAGTLKLLYVPVTAGGAMGTPVVIASQSVSGALTWLTSCAVDSRDMIHFTFGTSRLISTSLPSSNPFEFFYGHILGSTLGGVASIFAGINTGGAQYHMDTSSSLRGSYIAAEDKIYLPAMQGTTGPNLTLTSGSWPKDMSVVVIATASSAPSLSVDPISNVFGSGFFQYPCLWTSSCADVFYYGITELLAHSGILHVWCRPSSSGSWTGPTTWWDYSLNPPAGSPNTGDGQYTPLSVRSISKNASFGVFLPFQDNTLNSFSGGTLYYMEGANAMPCASTCFGTTTIVLNQYIPDHPGF